MPLPTNVIPGKFETSGPLASPYLEAEIGAYVTEVGGELPTCIIRTDQDWTVHAHWTLRGHLTEFICGKWCLSVFLESMGPGVELKLPSEELKIDLEPCAGENRYYAWVTIPAGTIPVEYCSAPFKLVVTVTYLTPKHKPGPMAGFVEGPILQFYEP